MSIFTPFINRQHQLDTDDLESLIQFTDVLDALVQAHDWFGIAQYAGEVMDFRCLTIPEEACVNDALDEAVRRQEQAQHRRQALARKSERFTLAEVWPR